MLVAHGFGGTKASVDADARDLAARGFVVLTWTARGFGASGGQIALDAPDAEVADARKLVDWLAQRPEVQQDGPGDPRVGVTGGSYGGALSLMLAGYDKRIDAIAPVITWNDLGQALFPNAAATGAPPADTPARGAFAPDGVFKRGWAGVFFASGRTAPAPAGHRADLRPVHRRSSAPPTPRPRRPGRISPATAALLARSSPASVTDRITAPTLLVQGEQDTLFGLDQADANARQIAAHGTPVKVTWYAGGHDGGAPDQAVRDQIGAWFDHWLAGRGPRAGPDVLLRRAVRRAGGAEHADRAARSSRRPTRASRATRRPRQDLPLTGDPQVVLTPAGASPAAITSLPGLGGALGAVAGRLTAISGAIPGQVAQFATAPVAAAPDGRGRAAGAAHGLPRARAARARRGGAVRRDVRGRPGRHPHPAGQRRGTGAGGGARRRIARGGHGDAAGRGRAGRGRPQPGR